MRIWEMDCCAMALAYRARVHVGNPYHFTTTNTGNTNLLEAIVRFTHFLSVSEVHNCIRYTRGTACKCRWDGGVPVMYGTAVLRGRAAAAHPLCVDGERPSWAARSRSDRRLAPTPPSTDHVTHVLHAASPLRTPWTSRCWPSRPTWPSSRP